jgi:hypothetical protein
VIRHSARLPFNFTAEFSWDGGRMVVAWSPDTPAGFKSRRAFMRLFDAYAAARAEFLELVATSMGGSVGVVDAPAFKRDAGVTVVRPAVRH